MAHGSALFYAHNISIIPVYNKLYSDRFASLIPKSFDGEASYAIDPDLPYYYNEWVKAIAKSFAKEFQIENWVNINGGQANISITEWLNLDLFLREAIVISTNKVFKAQRKHEAKLRSDLEAKIESQKEWKSPFEGAPKPSFIP